MPLLRLHASKLRQMLFPRSRPGVNTLKRLHAKQHGRPIARRDLIVIEPGMRQAWATNVVSEFHDMFDKHMGDGVDLEGKVPDMSAAMETCLDSVRSKFVSTDTPEFRFPSAIMYHGSTSPSRPVLLRMVWKVLCKALAAGQPDSYNDQSGFALAAHFGVGKSTLMRMTTCAISTMMPSTRVWPCYLDLSCKDIQNIDMDSLLEFLCEHYLGASSDDPHASAERTNACIVLFLDELETTYTWSSSFWEGVANFVSYPGTACFAASSASRLPLVVSGTDRERIRSIYGTQTPIRGSLNSTKLKLLPVSPMVTFEQYGEYLTNRWPGFHEFDEAEKQKCSMEAHLSTGGNFRLLGEQIERVKSGLPPFNWEVLRVSRPTISDAQWSVLEELAQRTPSDDMVSAALSFDKAVEIIRAYNSDHDIQRDPHAQLDRWTQSGSMLQEVMLPDGSTMIAARIPGTLTPLRPPVFVSHAIPDFDTDAEPVMKQFADSRIPASRCERPTTSLSAGSPLQREVELVRASSMATIVLSNEFFRELKAKPPLLSSGNSRGCIREADLILTRALVDAYPVVLMAKHSEKIPELIELITKRANGFCAMLHSQQKGGDASLEMELVGGVCKRNLSKPGVDLAANWKTLEATVRGTWPGPDRLALEYFKVFNRLTSDD